MPPNLDENPSCPFCTPQPNRIFLESDLILGLWDGFPVSPGHALLVPRRHVADWFDATADEQAALTGAISRARMLIEERAALEGRPKPDGYNVGFNAGAAAGQTVFHLHVHVIPRYAGDTSDPRGGIRHVIPAKAVY
jgi:diadenosine tetraphosphate (Ap4A) HIT family hydrolase